MKAIALFLLVLAVVFTSGCIAVSRQVSREPVTSGAGAGVIAGGQWEVEQEWQCSSPERFELERERELFNAASEIWFEDGWEMAGFDVVELDERVCLVGTFRRWNDV